MRSMTFAVALVVAAITVSAARKPAKKGPPPIDQQALRAQVLLDRAHLSPGQIDGSIGNVTKLMLTTFQSQQGLPATGMNDDATMQALEKIQTQQFQPTLTNYTIVYDDVRGPFSPIPGKMMLEAKLPSLNFTSVWDGLGEKFHCSPGLLHRLNPNQKSLKPGDQVSVPNVHNDVPQGVASISVSKSSRVVQALDASGKPVATYPATIGSEHDPLPIGEWKVTRVEWNPVFYYNPKLFWNAGPKDSKATIKPGPRNPVGVVWIGLNKEHYGLHGTPEPASVGHTTSHGCVRLTNWDAAELGQSVSPNMPVSFKE
ncbi:MAG TPA: L,D-transpeptidase [Bryobacteraceae bacterium]|jgi:lipoprotein-anchoring transpeptidase ErfK/SrfK|nr:L,D-transpeptidase [Bryobacteraceae bacterium]